MHCRPIVAIGLLGASLLVPLACTSTKDDEAPIDTALVVPDECKPIAVDPFKELLVVDEAVVDDPRSLNGKNGVWSFRHAIEEMTPPGVSTSTFMTDWLATFRITGAINLFPVPARNAGRINKTVLCPWLRATPENECDDSCGECKGRELDLAKAPFRLLAVVNRMDLNETSADPDGNGEGRLVFAVTDGPADDPKSQPLRMTIILEYVLPAAGGGKLEWVNRWHALGKHAAFDESYKTELAALTESFVRRGAAPDRPLGAAIRQVRTNEREFEWTWELREYHLDPSTLRLEFREVFNTPDRSLNGTPQLSEWVKANREAILRNQHVLPMGMTGGIAQPIAPWNVPGVDAQLRDAFTTETCDGCHQTSQPSLDVNFHVSPFRSGVEKLSRHVYDPAAPTDALRRRADSMRRQLCLK